MRMEECKYLELAREAVLAATRRRACSNSRNTPCTTFEGNKVRQYLFNSKSLPSAKVIEVASICNGSKLSRTALSEGIRIGNRKRSLLHTLERFFIYFPRSVQKRAFMRFF